MCWYYPQMDYFVNMANAEQEIYENWKSVALNMSQESVHKYRVGLIRSRFHKQILNIGSHAEIG